MAGHVSDSAPRKMIPCTTENTRQYKAKGLGNIGKYAHMKVRDHTLNDRLVVSSSARGGCTP